MDNAMIVPRGGMIDVMNAGLKRGMSMALADRSCHFRHHSRKRSMRW
jgi:hypothetical protein